MLISKVGRSETPYAVESSTGDSSNAVLETLESMEADVSLEPMAESQPDDMGLEGNDDSFSKSDFPIFTPFFLNIAEGGDSFSLNDEQSSSKKQEFVQGEESFESQNRSKMYARFWKQKVLSTVMNKNRSILPSANTKCCICCDEGPCEFKVWFHRFPIEDKELFELWKRVCGMDERVHPTPPAEWLVCSKHFRWNDYLKKNGEFTLHPDTVPSVCVPNPLSPVPDEPPALPSCFLCNCQGGTSRTNPVVFFKFPNCIFTQKNWRQACNLSSHADVSELRVCSKHFLPTDFVDARNPTMLKKEAVPSVGIWKNNKTVLPKTSSPSVLSAAQVANTSVVSSVNTDNGLHGEKEISSHLSTMLLSGGSVLPTTPSSPPPLDIIQSYSTDLWPHLGEDNSLKLTKISETSVPSSNQSLPPSKSGLISQNQNRFLVSRQPVRFSPSQTTSMMPSSTVRTVILSPPSQPLTSVKQTSHQESAATAMFASSQGAADVVFSSKKQTPPSETSANIRNTPCLKSGIIKVASSEQFSNIVSPLTKRPLSLKLYPHKITTRVLPPKQKSGIFNMFPNQTTTNILKLPNPVSEKISLNQVTPNVVAPPNQKPGTIKILADQATTKINNPSQLPAKIVLPNQLPKTVLISPMNNPQRSGQIFTKVVFPSSQSFGKFTKIIPKPITSDKEFVDETVSLTKTSPIKPSPSSQKSKLASTLKSGFSSSGQNSSANSSPVDGEKLSSQQFDTPSNHPSSDVSPNDTSTFSSSQKVIDSSSVGPKSTLYLNESPNSVSTSVSKLLERSVCSASKQTELETSPSLPCKSKSPELIVPDVSESPRASSISDKSPRKRSSIKSNSKSRFRSRLALTSRKRSTKSSSKNSSENVDPPRKMSIEELLRTVRQPRVLLHRIEILKSGALVISSPKSEPHGKLSLQQKKVTLSSKEPKGEKEKEGMKEEGNKLITNPAKASGDGFENGVSKNTGKEVEPNSGVTKPRKTRRKRKDWTIKGQTICYVCGRNGSCGNISFYRFPVNDSLLCNMWRTLCGVASGGDVSSLLICSMHFKPFLIDRKTNTLVPGACPTTNVPNPEGYKKRSGGKRCRPDTGESNRCKRMKLLGEDYDSEETDSASEKSSLIGAEEEKSQNVAGKLLRACMLCDYKDCGKENGRSLFKFPNNERICNLWKRACNIFEHDYMNMTSLFVCENHFSSQDLIKARNGAFVLKPGAIPSVGVPNIVSANESEADSSFQSDAFCPADLMEVSFDEVESPVVLNDDDAPEGEIEPGMPVVTGSFSLNSQYVQNYPSPTGIVYRKRFVSVPTSYSVPGVSTVRFRTLLPKFVSVNQNIRPMTNFMPVNELRCYGAQMMGSLPLRPAGHYEVIGGIPQMVIPTGMFPKDSVSALVPPQVPALPVDEAPHKHGSLKVIPESQLVQKEHQLLKERLLAGSIPKEENELRKLPPLEGTKESGCNSQNSLRGISCQPDTAKTMADASQKAAASSEAEEIFCSVSSPREPHPLSGCLKSPVEQLGATRKERQPPPEEKTKDASSQKKREYVCGEKISSTSSSDNCTQEQEISAQPSKCFSQKLLCPVTGKYMADAWCQTVQQPKLCSSACQAGEANVGHFHTVSSEDQNSKKDEVPSGSELPLPAEEASSVENLKMQSSDANPPVRNDVGGIKKELLSAEDLLAHLQHKNLISQEAADTVMSTLSVEVQEVIASKLQAEGHGKLSLELRSFALTLHVFSTEAYSYVRSLWPNLLPDSGLLRNWFSTSYGKPGFTQEVFDDIYTKSKENGGSFPCSVFVSEMPIRRGVFYESNQFYGTVNFGTELDLKLEGMFEAQKVLVFFVSALHKFWRCPIGYFFINSLSAKERANLMTKCLDLLNEVYATVVSVTIDGSPASISMCKCLGANFLYGENSKPWFLHPITKEKVFVFWDVCRMIRLVRDTLGDLGCLATPDSKLIKWSSLKLFVKLQNEGYMGNYTELSKRHLDYQNNRTDTLLCRQTFSQNICRAFRFARDNSLEQWRSTQATAKYCLVFCHILNMLCSENVFSQAECGSPITELSRQFLLKSASNFINYIVSLKDPFDIPILRSNRKTGFLGLVLNLKNVFELFDVLKKSGVKQLLTAKLSHEYVELFFATVRQEVNGNLPNAKQFQDAYRKLVLKRAVRKIRLGPSTCLVDGIEMMHLLSSKAQLKYPVRNFSDPIRVGNVDFSFMASISIVNPILSIAKCVAGYIVRKVLSQGLCSVCATQLTTEKHIERLMKVTKDKRFLKPTEDVCKICKMADIVFQEHKHSILRLRYSKRFFVNEVFNRVCWDVFNSCKMQEHVLEQGYLENHRSQLCKVIIGTFYDIKLFHEKGGIKQAKIVI